MSEELNVGFKVKTIDGRVATVQKRIGGGGQGDVYLVSYNNSPMALKWYKKSIMNNPQAFYENLVDNKEHGSPSAADRAKCAVFVACGCNGMDRWYIWLYNAFKT